jgi:glycosyltransferase involved in cell wall biosynthesis
MPHSYFEKQRDFTSRINNKPHPKLGISVVIPSYNEPNLRQSLEALQACKAPECWVEVIVVINYPEGSSHKVCEDALIAHKLVHQMNDEASRQQLNFIPILAENLPKKQAGVGFARKIGMDEAAFRFMLVNNPKGIIACFDADSTCKSNYLQEIEQFWTLNPSTTACSIRYEHPLSGSEFENIVYKGITDYELHLRYYIEAGRFIGHPHSFHTIGSSMACTVESYTRFGGMNRRKAGEDFYFLQKIIPHGGFAEINSTCVYPSPRPSLRVPFGTGRAMSKYLENPNEPVLTYSLDSWMAVKEFLKNAQSLSDINLDPSTFINDQHISVAEFLEANQFSEKIFEIRSNTSNQKSFEKRFFLWFDAFLLLKYLNFSHEKHFSKRPIGEESLRLAKLIGLNALESQTNRELLFAFRQKQNANNWLPL